MRVTMIIQSYLPRLGGAERQVHALAPLLKQHGVEVSVITRRYPGLKSFERMGSVPVYRMPAPGSKAVASLCFTIFSLVRLSIIRPDLIHAHELLSPATTAVAAKRINGTPVVAKVLRGGQLGDIAKLKSSPTRASRIPTLVREIDCFIVISREIDRELDGLGVPPGRRVYIPNGVDQDRFFPLPPEQKEKLRSSLDLPPGPLAIYSGRLTAEKNVEILLSIWAEVRHHCPMASLLIAGSGDQEYILRESAGDGVIFLGYQPDMVPYLQASDLFVLPSLTEGLSNALLEAMAAGLPVVATAVGGAVDLLSDKNEPGSPGILVPPGDQAALQSAVIDLLNPSATTSRIKMGNSARQQVMNCFSLKSTADQLHLLYRRILKDG